MCNSSIYIKVSKKYILFNFDRSTEYDQADASASVLLFVKTEHIWNTVMVITSRYTIKPNSVQGGVTASPVETTSLISDKHATQTNVHFHHLARVHTGPDI